MIAIDRVSTNVEIFAVDASVPPTELPSVVVTVVSSVKSLESDLPIIVVLSNVLLEDGFAVLLESGSNLLLEA